MNLKLLSKEIRIGEDKVEQVIAVFVADNPETITLNNHYPMLVLTECLVTNQTTEKTTVEYREL